MDADAIFTERELRFLRALLSRDVSFMVVGLSAAVLQGAPVGTQDVDLWFKNLQDEGIAAALEEVGGVYVPPSGANPPLFAGAGLELFDIVVHMHGLRDFDAEWEYARSIALGGLKVPTLSLERILASKEATNREKDRRAIPVLRDTLIALTRKPKEE